MANKHFFCFSCFVIKKTNNTKKIVFFCYFCATILIQNYAKTDYYPNRSSIKNKKRNDLDDWRLYGCRLPA